MNNVYLVDTVAFINYHNTYFSERNMLSEEARNIISKCLDSSYNHFKLIVPSVVFIEITRKFLISEELSKKFYYEIFKNIKECIDVEIKPLEKEIASLMLDIDQDKTLEFHDKVIYASAAQLGCTLITKDPKIIHANKREKVIPAIIF